MTFEYWTLISLLAFAVAGLFLAREVNKLRERVRTAETALSAVKPALEEYPKLANEVRDIRETLDELPLDDLAAQAAYEKAYAESLEAINNYSVEVAMKNGGDGG